MYYILHGSVILIGHLVNISYVGYSSHVTIILREHKHIYDLVILILYSDIGRASNPEDPQHNNGTLRKTIYPDLRD